jgi:DNA-binding MarR family transcriptional regulator
LASTSRAISVAHSRACENAPSKNLVRKSPDRYTISASGTGCDTATRCSARHDESSWLSTRKPPSSLCHISWPYPDRLRICLWRRELVAELRRSGPAIEMSQWSTLRRIGRSPCTMSELARYKGVGLPTISKSVDMLVRRGWVERWVDKSDRRQTLVRLTASGRRILADCRRALEDFLDQRPATLSGEAGALPVVVAVVALSSGPPPSAGPRPER